MGRSPALPEFVIIGAMKSATTTLFQYLRRHSHVFMCRPKEPQFFSRDHVFERGTSWYHSLFEAAEGHQICGEASTCYSRHPHYADVPARLKQANPDVKLIYVMRHPVDRAYSHYKHRMRRRVNDGEPILTLEEALVEEPETIDAGMYLYQIQQYLPHFDREQMLLLTCDDLFDDTAQTLERVQSFLDVPAADLLADGPLIANEGERSLERREWRRRFNRWREQTRLQPIFELVPTGPRRAMGRWLRTTGLVRPLGRQWADRVREQLTPLTPERREHLLNVYDEPTRQLEAFLERDLSHWRQ